MPAPSYLLGLLLLLPALAAAQPTAPLVTDRPDFTESGVVVPLGHVQVEAGVTLTDGDHLAGPELLVRWTPLPRVELRLGAPDYIDAASASGFGDPSVGVKVQLGPIAQWDLGVIASVSLPLGDDAFSSGSVDPEVIVTTAHPLGGRFDVGAQVGAARDGSADGWLGSGTLVLGAALSERWGAFAELAATVPERGGAEVLRHAGLTYALTPTVQLDAHVGLGLTEAAPASLVGVGVSIRR